MWKLRKFASKEKRDAWIEKNSYRYQITILYVNNAIGRVVEYRPLVKPGLPR